MEIGKYIFLEMAGNTALCCGKKNCIQRCKMNIMYMLKIGLDIRKYFRIV